MRKNFWLNLFLICAGIVIGTLIAKLTASNPIFSWLSYGIDFGLQTPIVLDLSVLQITFGLMMNLNISVIIFTVLAIIVGRAVAHRR